MKHVALGLICILTTAMPAIAWEPGDDWRDDQCESVIDGADRVANVCRGVYGRGEVFLGIYWNDGAEVVGPCNATESWPMEYRAYHVPMLMTGLLSIAAGEQLMQSDGLSYSL